ncbi:hypothetical protein FISHEDRAFT_74070 [Fistulina hepatica ATCC 64428]|uniref:Uncharacterized protein n=1 Tax=Fistulina hepatica ATCC 64428 TaxID=1128425 RepID=A0A0D7AB08_9AGAR|nr:hypothetical protein FISHEDRAFT_74070 [Fistulina hepatica ATCC 64428]
MIAIIPPVPRLLCHLDPPTLVDIHRQQPPTLVLQPHYLDRFSIVQFSKPTRVFGQPASVALRSLGLQLNTSAVNAERNRSAQLTLPRSVPLPRRQGNRMASSSTALVIPSISAGTSSAQAVARRTRPRGPSVAKPSLPNGVRVTINDCIYEGPVQEDGSSSPPPVLLSIICQVYPFLPSIADQAEDSPVLQRYLRLSETFVNFGNTYSLRFVYSIPPDFLVGDLMRQIKADMEASSCQWIFRPRKFVLPSATENERLPFALLRLKNKGTPIRSQGYSRVVLTDDHTSATKTIRDLICDSHHYIGSSNCNIVSAQVTGSPTTHQFVLNFVMIVNGSFLEPESDVRHSCLRYQFAKELFDDSYPPREPPQSVIDFEMGVNCGCQDEEESENIVPVFEDSLRYYQGLRGNSWTPSSNRPVVEPDTTASTRDSGVSAHVVPQLPDQPAEPSIPTQPISSTEESRNVSGIPALAETLTSAGDTLWGTPPDFLINGPHVYSFDNMALFWETAFGGNVPADDIIIRGDTVEDAASSLIAILRQCASEHDFMKVLNDDMMWCVGNANGDGVEREVIFTAFRSFTSRFNDFFVPAYDSYFGLKLRSRAFFAADTLRQSDLMVLGALAALMCLSRQYPEPFPPCLFVFICSQAENRLSALNSALVDEYHSRELCLTLEQWCASEGDLNRYDSFFLSYLDIPTATLGTISSGYRVSLAKEMLARATLGIRVEDLDHPELHLFTEGFSLRTRHGWALTKAAHHFSGGVEGFVRQTITTVIHDFASISSKIRYTCTLSTTTIPLKSIVQAALGENPESLLQRIVGQYLEGEGLIDEASLSPILRTAASRVSDYSHVDSSSFRPRLFALASTGSYFMDPDKTIKVVFCCDNDPLYSNGSAEENADHILLGDIAFHTCFNSLYIPATFVTELKSRTVENFTAQFTRWFEGQLLSAIGSHTIV